MTTFWGIVLTAVAGLAAALLTRRSAKDTAGITGLIALNNGLEKRVERLENRESKRDQLATLHSVWDEQVYDQARAAGWDVPRPPPLQ